MDEVQKPRITSPLKPSSPGIRKDISAPGGWTSLTPSGATVSVIGCAVVGQIDSTSTCSPSAIGRNNVSQAHQA